MASTNTVKDLILKRAKQQSRTLSSEQMHEAVSKVVNNLLTNDKEQHCMQFKQAYRLAGKTLFKVPPNLLGLQLETSYRGQYGQSYFVIIESDPKTNILKVKNTTLPYFIPIKRIEEMFLNKSIKAWLVASFYANLAKTFSNHLSTYINAFVSRQQQFFWLKDQGVEPKCSEPFDFAQINYIHYRRKWSIQIIYDNTGEFLPTRVMVTEEGKKKRWRNYEKSLKETPIPEAWAQLFP